MHEQKFLSWQNTRQILHCLCGNTCALARWSTPKQLPRFIQLTGFTVDDQQMVGWPTHLDATLRVEEENICSTGGGCENSLVEEDMRRVQSRNNQQVKSVGMVYTACAVRAIAC